MQILLAEDDRKLGNLIAHMLQKEKHSVDWVQNGEDAFDYAISTNYDILILDWMMPGDSGVNVCRRLRNVGHQTPILMLTAKDTLDDRVQGLDSGADDYLVKPFEFAELFARLRALSRRAAIPLKEETITIGDLELQCNSHSLYRNGEEIQLTPREFQLLELLARNRGQVIPREVIYERVWGYEADVTSNTIDAFVRLLRKKIDRPGQKKLISNVRGVGYKLEV
jgi:DNA-binding response OmpR family regulator